MTNHSPLRLQQHSSNTNKTTNHHHDSFQDLHEINVTLYKQKFSFRVEPTQLATNETQQHHISSDSSYAAETGGNATNNTIFYAKTRVSSPQKQDKSGRHNTSGISSSHRPTTTTVQYNFKYLISQNATLSHYNTLNPWKLAETLKGTDVFLQFGCFFSNHPFLEELFLSAHREGVLMGGRDTNAALMAAGNLWNSLDALKQHDSQDSSTSHNTEDIVSLRDKLRHFSKELIGKVNTTQRWNQEEYMILKLLWYDEIAEISREDAEQEQQQWLLSTSPRANSKLSLDKNSAVEPIWIVLEKSGSGNFSSPLAISKTQPSSRSSSNSRRTPPREDNHHYTTPSRHTSKDSHKTKSASHNIEDSPHSSNTSHIEHDSSHISQNRSVQDETYHTESWMKENFMQMLKSQEVQHFLRKQLSGLVTRDGDNSTLDTSRTDMLLLEDRIEMIESTTQKLRHHIDESIEKVIARMKVHVDSIQHEVRNMDQKREHAVQEVKKLIISFVSEATEDQFKRSEQRHSANFAQLKKELLGLHDDLHVSSTETGKTLKSFEEKLREIQRTVSENIVSIQEVRDESFSQPHDSEEMNLHNSTQYKKLEDKYHNLSSRFQELKKDHSASMDRLAFLEKEMRLFTKKTPREVKSLMVQLKEFSELENLSDEEVSSDEDMYSQTTPANRGDISHRSLPSARSIRSSPMRNSLPDPKSARKRPHVPQLPLTPQNRIDELEKKNEELFRQLHRLTHDYQSKIAKCDAQIQKLKQAQNLDASKLKTTPPHSPSSNHEESSSGLLEKSNHDLVEELKGVRSFLLDESQDAISNQDLQTEVAKILKSMKIPNIAHVDREIRILRSDLQKRLKTSRSNINEEQKSTREVLQSLHERISTINEDVSAQSEEIETLKRQIGKILKFIMSDQKLLNKILSRLLPKDREELEDDRESMISMLDDE